MTNIAKRAGEKLRTFIIGSCAPLVKLLPRYCEVCGERIYRDQLTSTVHVAHLGKHVTAHRFCSPWECRRAVRPCGAELN